MSKYIIYYRVSTRKQGESGLGLESQKAIVNHFLASEEIANSYTDVLSGKSIERPGLKKAIKECKQNGYTLAVAKIDRLSRKTEDALSIYEELNGSLLSCDIPNLDKFTLTIFMAIADRERELISIRTKQALAEKKKKGEKLGTMRNLTPQGRRKAHLSNRLKAQKNGNNSRAAALISEMRTKGMKLQEIADKLNESGFKTSTGLNFHKTTVSRLYKRGEGLQELEI